MSYPRYGHDCTNCTFLGQLAEFDIYTCPQPSFRPTIVARFGHEGEEYLSGDPVVLHEVGIRLTLERVQDPGPEKSEVL